MHGSGATRCLLALAAGAVLAVGCSRQDGAPAAAEAPGAAPPAAAPASAAPEGALDILALAGVVQDGQESAEYDWVSGFEGKTGCRVTVTVAATADELVTLLGTGGSAAMAGDGSWPPAGSPPHDVVIAPADVSLRLIRAGLVQAIDISRVPAFSTVDTRLRQAPWHYADGRHYGVPYQWGPNVLLYDTEVFTTAPTSWSVLFEPQKLPDGKPNRGRVQGHGAPIYIADAALYLKSRQQALRIQDPYELDEAQYAAALALLRGQRKLVQSYWQDAVAQVQAFRNDGIVAAQSRGNQAKAALANRLKVAWTVPAEGATGWADTTMLAAHAQHSNCAYRWLEWSLSPRVQADTAAWHGSVPAVPAACAGSELLGADGCSAHGADSFDRLAFWRTPEARCAAHAGGCVPHERWTKDFAAIIQETR